MLLWQAVKSNCKCQHLGGSARTSLTKNSYGPSVPGTEMFLWGIVDASVTHWVQLVLPAGCWPILLAWSCASHHSLLWVHERHCDVMSRKQHFLAPLRILCLSYSFHIIFPDVSWALWGWNDVLFRDEPLPVIYSYTLTMSHCVNSCPWQKQHFWPRLVLI